MGATRVEAVRSVDLALDCIGAELYLQIACRAFDEQILKACSGHVP